MTFMYQQDTPHTATHAALQNMNEILYSLAAVFRDHSPFSPDGINSAAGRTSMASPSKFGDRDAHSITTTVKTESQLLNNHGEAN